MKLVNNKIWWEVVKKVDKNKNAFGTFRQYMIWRNGNILEQKTMHEDLVYFKFNFEFCQFFLYDFWTLHFLILPDQNVLMHRDQNESIYFASDTYIGNIGTVWNRKLCTKTWYSPNSWWLLTIFLVLFFGAVTGIWKVIK